MCDNASAEAQASDPLKTVADAMEHAVQAARDGASDAKAKVDQALPAVNRFVSRFVYTTCYTISYGVVFPSMLVARSIPKNNPIVHGLVDGAHAAVDMVEEMKKRKLEAPPASPRRQSLSPEQPTHGLIRTREWTTRILGHDRSGLLRIESLRHSDEI